MNLGLILTPGDSLTKQRQAGQLDRLIAYYLQPYSQQFDKVYLFSFGDRHRKFKLPANITLVPKPWPIPYQFYQLLLPFIQFRLIRQINLFRVFQAIGGLPALIIKIFFHKPYVVTYGYHYHQFARIEGYPLKAKLISRLIRPVLNQAKSIIVPSQENLHYLTQLNLADKLVHIPNGINPQIFKPGKSVVQTPPYLVLTIGRLTRQKNHQLLIKAVSNSKYKHHIKLVIIGQGFLRNKLINLARQLKVNLKIIPNLPHPKLLSWYQQAVVFALTSKIEGQPKVLLEAMSSGCACLTTPFLGNIIVDGQTGLIADPSKLLTVKLDSLLKNPQLCQKLSQQARLTILRQYNINKLVLREIKLLKILGQTID